MKCYFLIPLLFFFGAISFSAFGDNKNGKDNEESIYIVISDQITPEIDRSVHLYVSASINRHMKVIEVNHYGVGNGNIYIIDSNNTLIQLSSFIDTSCCTYISVPEVPGGYRLIISSDKYYGEGVFSVY